MNGYGNKKRKVQAFRAKSKGAKWTKSNVEDVYPVEVPNLQSLSPEIKQYINELERQYIDRYNILLANRSKYEEIVQNISVQLDQKGVTNQIIAKMFRSAQQQAKDKNY